MQNKKYWIETVLVCARLAKHRGNGISMPFKVNILRLEMCINILENSGTND